MRLSIRVFDYFFVLRPTLFFAVWTVSLAGLWSQQRFTRPHNEVLSESVHIGSYDITYIAALACFTLIMGGVFLLNQIHDIESDRLNNKLYLVANGDVSIAAAYIESAILVVIPTILILWLRPILGLAMVLTFVVTGWFYSFHPFNWKNRPFYGLTANMFGYMLVFSTGWLIKGNLEWDLLLHATPYVLGITAVYFFTTIPDMEGDRKANKITVAVRFGLRSTIYCGLLFDIAAVIMSAILLDLVILIPTMLSLPFFINAVLKLSVAEVLRTNKYGTLFLSLVICIRFPGYLILIILIFFASKWYYKRRFGITYPSFKTS